jgi:hypothetical protein
MQIGDIVVIDGQIIQITDEVKSMKMDRFNLGKFLNCTVGIFKCADDKIMVLQDMDDSGGACQVYIIPFNKNVCFCGEWANSSIKTYKNIYK